MAVTKRTPNSEHPITTAFGLSVAAGHQANAPVQQQTNNHAKAKNGLHPTEADGDVDTAGADAIQPVAGLPEKEEIEHEAQAVKAQRFPETAMGQGNEGTSKPTPWTEGAEPLATQAEARHAQAQE
jgi:hypothetical protein